MQQVFGEVTLFPAVPTIYSISECFLALLPCLINDFISLVLFGYRATLTIVVREEANQRQCQRMSKTRPQFPIEVIEPVLWCISWAWTWAYSSLRCFIAAMFPGSAPFVAACRHGCHVFASFEIVSWSGKRFVGVKHFDLKLRFCTYALRVLEYWKAVSISSMEEHSLSVVRISNVCCHCILKYFLHCSSSHTTGRAQGSCYGYCTVWWNSDHDGRCKARWTRLKIKTTLTAFSAWVRESLGDSKTGLLPLISFLFDRRLLSSQSENSRLVHRRSRRWGVFVVFDFASLFYVLNVVVLYLNLLLV